MNTTKLYKLSNFFYRNKFLSISKVIDKINYKLNKCVVSGSTKIGSNTEFAYGGISIVIHKESIIGKNCMIG